MFTRLTFRNPFHVDRAAMRRYSSIAECVTDSSILRKAALQATAAAYRLPAAFGLRPDGADGAIAAAGRLQPSLTRHPAGHTPGPCRPRRTGYRVRQSCPGASG